MGTLMLNGEVVSKAVNNKSLLDLFALAFNQNREYVIGNVCMFNGTMYECIEDTTGPFDNSKWKVTSVLDAIGIATATRWEKWLEAGRVVKKFESLDEVLEDEITVRQLMTVHASADYLLHWYKKQPSILETFVASKNAMKWIGLRDYICDKLMAIDEWKTAMLESEFWEYILKDHVPVMTSDTAPYGVASASSDLSEYGRSPWHAFDNNNSSFWRTANKVNTTTATLQYKFVNPICIKKVYFSDSQSFNTLTTVKIEISNDNNNWIEIGEFQSQRDVTTRLNDNNIYCLYARIRFTDANATFSDGYKGCLCGTLQFYGRALNVSVPTMTSNTEPYGVIDQSSFSTISNGEQRLGFNAFDGNAKGANGEYTAWIAKTGENEWVSCNFGKDVLIKSFYFQVRPDYPKRAPKNFDIEIMNANGEWIKVQSFTNTVETLNPVYFSLSNPVVVNSIRLYANNTLSGDLVGIMSMNFYGVDYSEREFAEGSTIHYIYDHGLELSPIETININNSSGYIKKNAENIEMKGLRSTTDSVSVRISTNFTNENCKYSKAVLSDNLIMDSSATWILIYSVWDSGYNSTDFTNHKLASKLQILPSIVDCINISSFIGNYNFNLGIDYGKASATTNGTLVSINEWWLE